MGDDADTTGAIYGQIAGAELGKSGLPDSWLKKLRKMERIEKLALALTT